jgi:hypothetical protein
MLLQLLSSKAEVEVHGSARRLFAHLSALRHDSLIL